MSTASLNTTDLKAENDLYVTSLRSLSHTRNSSEIDEGVTDSLDVVKRIYDRITDDLCRVSLKMVNSNGLAVTYLLDRQHSVQRAWTDVEFNTCSSHIDMVLRELMGATQCATYFLCNDLSCADKCGRSGFERSKCGHAALVATVRPPVTAIEQCYDVIGFLCVENAKGGFDYSAAKTLVACAYELYFALSAAYQKTSGDYCEPLSLK